jgi:hypothetical protein
MKHAQLEDQEIPEQNLDFVLGSIGGNVQVHCTFKGEEKPALVSKIEEMKETLVEALLTTHDGRGLSGIYLVQDVKVEEKKSFKPPLWKVAIDLQRQ